MIINKNKFNKIISLLLGNGVGAASSLMRNIIIARSLSIEDYGIAAAILLLLTIFEAISNVSIDRYIVQSKHGNYKNVHYNAHTLQLIIGIMTATLIIVFSLPISELFNIPYEYPVFIALATMPLLVALNNLDYVRFQRHSQFSRTIAIQITPQLISLGSTVPILSIVQDYKAVPIILAIQVISQLALSHLIALRGYRLQYDKEVVNKLLVFGWPLIMNGLLLMVINQGDKVIVASQFSSTELGLFAAAFSLTFMPTTLVSKIIRIYGLPILSRRMTDSEFSKANSYILHLTALPAILCCAVSIIAGPELLVLILGEKYRAAGQIMMLLGIMQSFRMLRTAPMLTALSCANTKIILLTNVIRSLFIIVAFGFATHTGELIVIPIVGIVAEFFTLIFSFILVKSKTGNRTEHLVIKLFYYLIWGATIPLILSILIPSSFKLLPILIGLIYTLIFIYIFYSANKALLKSQ